LPPDYLAEVRQFADDQRVAVHLDGARIFNAAVGSGISVADIARHADSVQFCLSKGLGAPIGSLVAGSTEFIQRVRRIRKMLGGGMRQAGIIAAPGIPAIRNAARLIDDHRMAARFGRALAGIEGIELCAEVQTNIVLFRVVDDRHGCQDFIAEAWSAGLAVSEFGHGRLRAVFHSGVTEADVDAAVRIVRHVIGADRLVTAAVRARES
jgi:threonine aldolase